MKKHQGLSDDADGNVPLFLRGQKQNVNDVACKFSRGAALPNAPSTAHGARSAAWAVVDGAVTESLLQRSCADQLRRAHSARRVRDGADAAATAAATELMLRAALLRRSCDGVAAATEQRRPAPSRSFCASRLDATRWMRSQHHFPSCWFKFQWSWPTVLGRPPGPVILGYPTGYVGLYLKT